MGRRVWMIVGVLGAIWIALFVYGMRTNQFDSLKNVVFQGTSRPPVVSSSLETTPVPLPPSVSASTSTHETNATIVRVVDGDTVVAMEDGKTVSVTIRLLGINTPETVDPRKQVQCFGKEASAFMHKLLSEGQRIDLVADPQADEQDKYNRLLRNIVLADGTDVNALLVREGYAHAYLSFPLTPSRKREIKRLEDDARVASRGLWSPTTCNGKTD